MREGGGSASHPSGRSAEIRAAGPSARRSSALQARNYVITASPNSKSPHFLSQAPHLQCRNVPASERPRSHCAASTWASLPLTSLTDSGALPFPHSPLSLPIWDHFALSPLRPSQPLCLLIHLPVVHLTPGAHIVWVRGQMHEGHPSGSKKRRGCEGRVRSHDRSKQADERDPCRPKAEEGSAERKPVNPSRGRTRSVLDRLPRGTSCG